MIRNGVLSMLATGVLVACGQAIYQDGEGVPSGGLGQPCGAGGSCDPGLHCDAGHCLGSSAVSGFVPADVDSNALRMPITVGCRRAHNECFSICDNIFVECWSDQAQCVEEYVRSYLERYTYPMIDPALAAQCAADAEAARCGDLEPDTPACDNLLVEGCYGDTDAYGTPYSYSHAVPIQLGQTLELYLCADAPEWFEVSLQAGDELLIGMLETPPAYVDFDLHRLATTPTGTVVLERAASLSSLDGVGSIISDPIAAAGSYLLSVRLGNGSGNVSVSVGSPAAPGDLCPADNDGYGKPYSSEVATTVAAGQVLDLYLCRDTAEWFELPLQQGESLALALLESPPDSVDVDLYRRATDATGAPTLKAVGYISTLTASNGDETSDPVPSADNYLLSVNVPGASGNVRLSVGSTLHPAPTVVDGAREVFESVYDGLCARLHGDCSAVCDDDYFCGETSARCVESYVARASAGWSNDTLSSGTAALCAAGLAGSACADLLRTPGCADFLVRGCAARVDGFSFPNDWQVAIPVALPHSLDVEVCGDTELWLAVDLSAGDVLQMDWPHDDYARVSTYAPAGVPNDYLDWESTWGIGTIILDPVPTSGVYYLEVSLPSTLASYDFQVQKL